MCAIRSNPYGWDLRKIAKNQFKRYRKGHFWTFYIFSKTVQAIETIFTVILYHIRTPYVQLDQNRTAGIWERKSKLVLKKTKAIFGLFIFSQKLCRRLKRFFTVILHHIRAPCVQLDQNRIAEN